MNSDTSQNLHWPNPASIMFTCQYGLNSYVRFDWSVILLINESEKVIIFKVKTPIQNYFEKVLYENLTF
jgi:hypothetical protein